MGGWALNINYLLQSPLSLCVSLCVSVSVSVSLCGCVCLSLSLSLSANVDAEIKVLYCRESRVNYFLPQRFAL